MWEKIKQKIYNKKKLISKYRCFPCSPAMFGLKCLKKAPRRTQAGKGIDLGNVMRRKVYSENCSEHCDNLIAVFNTSRNMDVDISCSPVPDSLRRKVKAVSGRAWRLKHMRSYVMKLYLGLWPSHAAVRSRVDHMTSEGHVTGFWEGAPSLSPPPHSPDRPTSSSSERSTTCVYFRAVNTSQTVPTRKVTMFLAGAPRMWQEGESSKGFWVFFLAFEYAGKLLPCFWGFKAQSIKARNYILKNSSEQTLKILLGARKCDV